MVRELSKILQKYIRNDLQLHFLWSFFLTTLGIFFPIMIWSGLVATFIKEALDLWIKGRWNWDDIAFGIAGWVVALFFLQQI